MAKSTGKLKGKEEPQTNENSNSPSRRKADLIATKERQIAAGASKVMLKKGYHATTIREIARECDMSMGQLYTYISSKDDVLYIVFRQMYQTFIEHIKLSKQEEIKAPIDRLREAILHTLRFMSSQGKYVQLLFTESRHLDKQHLNAILDMDRKNIIGFWREMLSEFDQFKNNEKELQFAASIVHYLLVFLPLRGWTIGDRPIDENIDSLTSLILRALGLDTTTHCL
jgi:AcrR family transcriptional regulator